jgi:type IV pilus assembly protein PilE
MTTLSHHRKRAAAGFTLVELLVTIIVATILISISVPSYQNQVRKSRRTEAKTALLDLAAREERYNSTNSGYTNSTTAMGFAGVANFPVTIGSGYYQVNVTSATASAFTLTATPVSTSPQSKDTSCASFTLDNTGAQSATDSGGTTNAACWQ